MPDMQLFSMNVKKLQLIFLNMFSKKLKAVATVKYIGLTGISY